MRRGPAPRGWLAPPAKPGRAAALRRGRSGPRWRPAASTRQVGGDVGGGDRVEVAGDALAREQELQPYLLVVRGPGGRRARISISLIPSPPSRFLSHSHHPLTLGAQWGREGGGGA